MIENHFCRAMPSSGAAHRWRAWSEHRPLFNLFEVHHNGISKKERKEKRQREKEEERKKRGDKRNNRR